MKYVVLLSFLHCRCFIDRTRSSILSSFACMNFLAAFFSRLIAVLVTRWWFKKALQHVIADKSLSKEMSWGIQPDAQFPVSLLSEAEVATAAVILSGSNPQMSKGRDESELP